MANMAKSDIVLDKDWIDLLVPRTGSVRVGGAGGEGDLLVRNGQGENRIHLDGGGDDVSDGNNPDSFSDSSAPIYANQHGFLRVGSAADDGDLVVKNGQGENRIHLDGASDDWEDSPAPVYANQHGSLRLGIKEQNGRLTLRDNEGTSRVKITGGRATGETDDTTSPTVGDTPLGSEEATPRNGGQQTAVPEETRKEIQEDIQDQVDIPSKNSTRIHLDGHHAFLTIGGDGEGGSLVLQDPDGDPEGGPRIHFSTNPDEETHLSVQTSDGSTALTLSADGTLQVANKLVVDGVDIKDEIDELKEGS